MGFSVLTAQNGREGLEIYRIHGKKIDLILLDLIMPEMGGIETYNMLRATDPNLFIIICSGYGGESVAGVICNDPFAEFVHKPYDPAQLRSVIKNMMERHACESMVP
jgi:CheY-like chemotaxis protein